MIFRAKHELVKAKDLVGRVNFAVRFKELTIPEIKLNTYPLFGAQPIPSEKMVITEVNTKDSGYVDILTLKYAHEANGKINIRRLYVRDTDVLTVLTGVMGKKLVKDVLATLDKGFIENVSGMLAHICIVGSDPEMFVEDDKGEVIPAFEFLKKKGTKGVDLSTSGTYGNKPIYWDGFQAEFETHPEKCLAWQVDSVQHGLEGLLRAALKHNKTAKLSTKTVYRVPEELLENTKEEFVQLGCMPSYNAYELKGEPLANGRELSVRSAGGHIHFGCGKKDAETTTRIVKTLDAILGVACVSLFAKYDNPLRRRYYGLAGEYRTPAHGIEYRTLSNAWLIHPYIMNSVFDLARKAFVFGEKGFLRHWDATEKETIDCINTCDVEKAQKILNRNKTLFIKILTAAYPGFTTEMLEKQFELFIKGIDFAVKDSSDFVKNWTLNTNVNEGRKWTAHSDGMGKNVKFAIRTIMKGDKVA